MQTSGLDTHGMPVEIIAEDDRILGYVIRGTYIPSETFFITPPEYKQQVGYVVYPNGGEVPRHTHVPLERHLVGTSEVIIVKEGACFVDFYSDEKELVATRHLRTGDIMLMVGGGHGFRMTEDTVLLEIKQGPYVGVDEKERF